MKNLLSSLVALGLCMAFFGCLPAEDDAPIGQFYSNPTAIPIVTIPVDPGTLEARDIATDDGVEDPQLNFPDGEFPTDTVIELPTTPGTSQFFFYHASSGTTESITPEGKYVAPEAYKTPRYIRVTYTDLKDGLPRHLFYRNHTWTAPSTSPHAPQ